MRETNSSPLLLQVFFCEPFLQLDQRGICKLFSVRFCVRARKILPLSGSSKGFGFDLARLYASNIFLHLGTALGQALVIKSTASRRILAHSEARSSIVSNWVPGQTLVNLQAFQDQGCLRRPIYFRQFHPFQWSSKIKWRAFGPFSLV